MPLFACGGPDRPSGCLVPGEWGVYARGGGGARVQARVGVGLAVILGCDQVVIMLWLSEAESYLHQQHPRANCQLALGASCCNCLSKLPPHCT
jgi:hypothetical protein